VPCAIPIEDASQLDLQSCAVRLPRPLGELPSPDWLVALLRADAHAPLATPQGLRESVRDLLRGHGYKPTGRGKPSSEYLAAAAAEGRLGPINAVVDACNAVSLHSGLPISVVDRARVQPPLRVRRADPGSAYVFNKAAQQIDVGGLLCLLDAEGPCANAVKDAQRTKTDESTLAVLALVWAPRFGDGTHARAAARWLGELLARLGALVETDAGAGY
jgi:DNA/RNA-binding domain of Phe-tRNA-synthetase-like protein